jgi:glutamyl-tRNA reductase
MTGQHTAVVAIVAHARAVRAADRARLGDVLRAASVPGLLVETCHRVELYAHEAAVPPPLLNQLPGGVDLLDGRNAARHAIAVAVGLDSVIVGEDQILHQLRTATTAARADGRLDPLVERLMNVALRAGRLARSWRSGPTRTLADAALEAIERRQIDLHDARVLVVGTGEMGRLTVDRARARGARVAIASRTFEHAEAVARTSGASAAPFDPAATMMDLAAIVVALRGAWTPAPRTIEALIDGSAIIVDLSVPMAIPQRLAVGIGDRLVSIDDLAVATTSPVSQQDHARMAALVERSLADYERWADGHDRRSAAEALVRLAEAERHSELDRLWQTHPEMDPAAREAVERMSRHLTGRLLREPLERLGQDADGRAAQAARDLFAL